MPRYYRRRATRVIKPKKKWATNIRVLSIDTGSTALGAAIVGAMKVLCANSTETDFGSVTAPTPTVLKCGNFKIQADAHIVTSASAYVRLMLYIMYIPEGVWRASTADTATQRYFDDGSTLTDLVTRHPEWILAWRQFGTDFINSDTNLDRVTFSSRLKRNLNSGDQICAVMISYKEDAAATGNINRLMISGTCQFWTCTN